jgi:hypothetical protein
VRRVYDLAIAGYGLGVITKKLETEGVPVIGRAEHWARSYVAKLLRNRAVIGEYQPYKGRGTKREPDGKPIAGYFPAIVTEAQWYAARGAMESRRTKPGRLPKERINVFSGLLRDARDGGTLQLMNKGKKGGGRLLVSYKGVQGVEGSRVVSFPFNTFESAILSCLREIDPREVLPDNPREDKTDVLSGRLAELEAEIAKLKDRLHRSYSDAVADVLERHEQEQKELGQQMVAAWQETSSPLGEAWGEAQTLADAIDAAPDADDARVRLRAALRRVVKEIWCLFIGFERPARGSATRLAAVQLWFEGGSHRDYLIHHRPATGGSVGIRPARWEVRSFASKAGEFDLRNRKHAAELERVLGEL